ncbi:MAG: hypothetical protein Q7R41_02765 [Phycisphaerales bacterium]|nr:hypothetical protein [Phycisphaerales bacterium]
MADDLLNRRNTAAVEQTLADMNERVYAQQEQINALRATVSSLLERLAESERGVLLLRASLVGRGPTVK